MLGGLMISATEIRALSATEPLVAATYDLPNALPFLEGAPSPLAIMALGCLVVGVTFRRRFRPGRAGS
jgi:hypothetical protein